jgi:hypothetical protein
MGVCSHCHKRPAEGWACDICRASNAATKKALRDSRRKSGLCIKCGKPTNASTVYCELHAVQSMLVKAMGTTCYLETILAKLHAQRYKCYYSGLPIILGATASLDHRNPRVRFPDEWSDPNNIVWVHKIINRMKTDMTHTEFVDMCTTISQRFSSNDRT